MNKISYKDIAQLGTLFFKNFEDKTEFYYFSGKMRDDKCTITKISAENIPENDEGFPIFDLDSFCHHSGFFIKIIE